MGKKIDPVSSAYDFALAWNAAAFVILRRTMTIQAAMLKGDLSGGPEARRMVSEKIAAAGEGAAGAWRAAYDLSARPPTSMAAAQSAAASIAAAATRPAMRRARANARRLAK